MKRDTKRSSSADPGKMSNKHSVNSSKRTNSGVIRIIAGQFGGRKLNVINKEGLRPTTDRMKETLFNWLMHDISDAVCLDAFAGSGGLGIESLSRHAQTVYFIEKDKEVARTIQSQLDVLRLEKSSYNIINNNTVSALERLGKSKNIQFNIVFLDPPFHANLISPSINALIDHSLLATSSKVYIEREITHQSLVVPSNWRVIKEKKTSETWISLYSVE